MVREKTSPYCWSDGRRYMKLVLGLLMCCSSSCWVRWHNHLCFAILDVRGCGLHLPFVEKKKQRAHVIWAVIYQQMINWICKYIFLIMNVVLFKNLFHYVLYDIVSTIGPMVLFTCVVIEYLYYINNLEYEILNAKSGRAKIFYLIDEVLIFEAQSRHRRLVTI